MRSFRDMNPYVVGIVSVLVIGAATGFAFMVGVLNLLESTYKVEAVFVEAGGLRTGDDVRLAGVKVGRVTKVEPDRRTGLVEVEFVVDNGTDFSRDAGADIALSTLLGTKHIRIANGRLPETFDDTDTMEGQDPAARVIPVQRTTVAFDIFELTRLATRGVENTDNEKLNQLINSLADVTEGKREQVSQLLTGIDSLATEITARDQQLEDLLVKADRLTGILAEKDDTIVALIDASNEILDFIAARRDRLQRALGEGSKVVQELNRILFANESVIDRALDVIDPTLALVDENLADVNTALAYIGEAYYQQGLAGTHGDFIDIYVNQLGTPIFDILAAGLGVDE